MGRLLCQFPDWCDLFNDCALSVRSLTPQLSRSYGSTGQEDEARGF